MSRRTVACIVVIVAFLSVQSSVAETLTQKRADAILAKYGIDWYASGGCTDRTKDNCTALEGIHDFVLFEVVFLKQASGCKVTITGGTETGHQVMQFSHENGYKVDLRLSSKQSPRSTCIIDFIERTADYRGKPKPGWKSWQWVDATYTLESDHWDIVKIDWGGVDRKDYVPY